MWAFWNCIYFLKFLWGITLFFEETLHTVEHNLTRQLPSALNQLLADHSASIPTVHH